MKKTSCIVCYLPSEREEWRGFVPKLSEDQVKWHFYCDKQRGLLERYYGRLSVFRTCLELVRSAKQLQADLIITYNPRLSFWCIFFSTLLGVQTKHIAYSFNYHELPHGVKRRLQKWAFTNINQFIVHSKLEKQLYSDYFGIPTERIEVRLWCMAVPKVQPEKPLETGDYICALGGNARDYQTLMTAMRKLPDIQMIIVVRPSNLKNLSIPPNVKVMVNIDEAHAMNILKYSRFMVLPLKGSEVPCGHVTLVAAMHLGKAFVITNSSGVSDYVFHNYNGVTCEPFAPDALAEAIRTLWNDAARCQQLGKNGRQFAEEHCSEELGPKHLQHLLFRENLLMQYELGKAG